MIADLEIDDLERAQARLNMAERNLEFQIRRAQINLDIAISSVRAVLRW